MPMTNAPSGRPSRESFAHYSHATCAWRTFQPSLLPESLPEQSATWPRAGMTRSGYAYELPMSEHRIGESGSSSLLPTPDANMGNGGRLRSQDVIDAKSRQIDLDNIARLLPTPTSRDHEDGVFTPNVETNGLLGRQVWLLPTPAAHDSGNTPENHLRKKPGREVVTSLQVIVDHDLLSTGGRIEPQSADGNTSPDDELQPQPNQDREADNAYRLF